MSSSYLIANVDFGNADQAAAYGRQVPQTVAKYGGRYLVRGGAAEVVEGAWRPTYMVVLEFRLRSGLGPGTARLTMPLCGPCAK
jgi:uncharacterized protein (DUF1330 family)